MQLPDIATVTPIAITPPTVGNLTKSPTITTNPQVA